jgi:uncharacterized protein YjbI with pentapeptide repeats
MLMAGCSKSDSYGAYERELQRKEKAVHSVERTGAKMVQKTYPQMPNVKAWAVNLSGQQLTPATFAELGRVGFISELNLSKTNLSDADMARVNGLANFCLVLDLSQTEVSDTGLAELKSQIVLRDLNLAGTKCTSAGVAALKKRQAENPNARIKTPTVRLK